MSAADMIPSAGGPLLTIKAGRGPAVTIDLAIRGERLVQLRVGETAEAWTRRSTGQYGGPYDRIDDDKNPIEASVREAETLVGQLAIIQCMAVLDALGATYHQRDSRNALRGRLVRALLEAWYPLRFIDPA